jgi:FkbM family methyltransferase
MKIYNNIGSKIINAIEFRRHKILMTQNTPLGDFYRAGGNSLLYKNLYLNDGSISWDVGGYHGDWSSEIMVRYGSNIEIFEPAPDYYNICKIKFNENKKVSIHPFGLSNSTKKMEFSLVDSGTSAFLQKKNNFIFTASVIDINDVLKASIVKGLVRSEDAAIGCIKINIEGGEYDVLERLIENNKLRLFRVILIQFHRQPEGYQKRYEKIINAMSMTHKCIWNYSMVWGRWDLL